MKNVFNVLRAPIVTEKSTRLKGDQNKVVFEVARDAAKRDVKAAIEKAFKVDVVDINTMICRGKFKRVGKTMGRRNNWKKAVVTLKTGADVDVFGIGDFTGEAAGATE